MVNLRYLQILATLTAFAFILPVTLNVTSAQDAEQLTEREDLERIKKAAVNAYLTTPVDDLPMSDATDTLRTMRALVNQETEVLWETMCEAEKEALGSRDRYQEFLQTFEGEFAVQPDLYWAQTVQRVSEPLTSSTSMQIDGLAYDSRTGMISRLGYAGREQMSVLPFHVLQLYVFSWPAKPVAPAASGGLPGLTVDEMAFTGYIQGNEFIPVYQHIIKQLKANIDELESFGVTRRDMCHPESGSYRDMIAFMENNLARMLEEQDGE